jgi:hypothetical protein
MSAFSWADTNVCPVVVSHADKELGKRFLDGGRWRLQGKGSFALRDHFPAQSSTSACVAPTDTLSSSQTDFSKATSTGDLLKQMPSVSGRRLSGINIDAARRSQLQVNSKLLSLAKARLVSTGSTEASN